MARITVEDCIKQVRNQYDLVILAKERTVQLGRGAAPSVDPEDDKKPVIALREIGESKIAPTELEESIVNKLRRIPDYQEEEDLEEVDNDTFRQMYQGGLSKSEMEKSATRKFIARIPKIEPKQPKESEGIKTDPEIQVSSNTDDSVETLSAAEDAQEGAISTEESLESSINDNNPDNVEAIEEGQLSDDTNETFSSEELSDKDDPTKED